MRSGSLRLRRLGAIAALASAVIVFACSPLIRRAPRPNVVLYIIDGAAAELMSVYGHKSRTTPWLERLAAEGAVFENAYSNSSFTKTSVQSFMTSLHSSVLGGFLSEADPLPSQAMTMAERMHKAGYLTMVLTANPFCGRMSSLDRGLDVLQESGLGAYPPASAELSRAFWRQREAHPAEPYWVHFQSTDVHRPWAVTSRPFGAEVDSATSYRIARRLYEEALILQDREIGRLVEGFKRRGEWERTLFIVAADHSQVSAGLPLIDPQAPPWEAPILASQKSRIPLIFVWVGKIPAGRRITEPVSMIDLLPTVLDLAGLPPLKASQGRSLAPLLLGKRGWEPRPVILDEFHNDGSSTYGSIEVIDGRWGASLRIDPRPDDKKQPVERLRPAPLLVFDVREDPHAFKSLHESRPDLVDKYSKMLDGIWKEHQALAKKFTRSAKVALTKEQIETLRSLGYVK